jgi:cell division septation protein DedD
MTIEFECDCGEILQVSHEYAGRRGRCPSCQKIVTVPEISPDTEQMEPIIAGETGEGVESIEVTESEDFPSELEDFDRTSDAAVSYLHRGDIWRKVPKWSIPAAIVAIVVLFFLLRSGDRETMETGPPKDVDEVVSVTEEPSAQQLPAEPAEGIKQPQDQAPAVPAEKLSEAEMGEALDKMVKVSPPQDTKPEEEAKKMVEEKGPAPEKQAEPRPEPELQAGGFTVNLATFKEKSRADQYLEELKKDDIDAFVWTVDLEEKGAMHRVSTGRFSTRQQAEVLAKELEEKKKIKTFVVEIPAGQR